MSAEIVHLKHYRDAAFRGGRGTSRTEFIASCLNRIASALRQDHLDLVNNDLRNPPESVTTGDVLAIDAEIAKKRRWIDHNSPRPAA